MSEDETVYDLLVLGGGVVGLSILRSAQCHGWNCILVEAESDLLSWASGSNSGIACTGVDASPGTLERALIRDSVSRIREFCRDHNIPTRPCGSLVCQWPWDKTDEGGSHTLDDVLLESHDAGDTHASKLSSTQVLALEPNLSKSCLGAIHIPGEIVVDPWLFSITYAVHAKQNGAKILTDWEFDADASSFDGKMWTAVRSLKSDKPGLPRILKAKTIVNAAGLWSDNLQAKMHQKIPSAQPLPVWEGRPRRGQYRIYQANSNSLIQRPIQPIPTQRTKGVFVFSSLYDQICVGPTALDQESKTDRSVDPLVSQELAEHARKIISSLDTDRAYVGDYVGLRPGTDKRDYQIHTSAKLNWIAAAGIRSTGLTASLGIGRHIVHLLSGLLREPLPRPVKTTPLPHILSLVEQYHTRGDGTVCIHGGVYKVTHPITKFGWERRSGLASAANLEHHLAHSKL